MTAWQPLLAQTESVAEGLTISGTIVMLVTVGLVCALCAFCFWKILTEPEPSEHHHAPLDIDTHDVER